MGGILLGTLEDPDGNYVQVIDMTGDGPDRAARTDAGA